MLYLQKAAANGSLSYAEPQRHKETAQRHKETTEYGAYRSYRSIKVPID